MKKKIFFVLLFSVFFRLYASGISTNESEISLYNEINSYFNTEYYPGVVEKTELLEKHFPESVFINPALILKAEAFIKLGQYSNAEQTCLNLIPQMHFGSEGFSRVYYLLGLSYYYPAEYSKAAEAFYKSTSIAQKEKNDEYYAAALLYGAKTYFKMNQFGKAVLPLEYVIQNGKAYSHHDYAQALQQLFVCYEQLSRFNKTVTLYEQLNQNDFDEDVFTFLTMYAADAYSQTKNPQKAYDLYLGLIENQNENISVTALKKAYIISSQNNLINEPSEILEKINNSKANPDNTLAEFWTRLGIDSYKQGDFSKAKECFSYAQEKNIPSVNLIIYLYQAKIDLEQVPDSDLSAKKEKAAEVFEKLIGLEAQIKDSQTKNILDSYYSLLIYAAFCKNDWNFILNNYEKIENPDSQVYYIAASAYYKNLNYEKAEALITKDLSVLQNQLLYASILAKQKKYSQAEKLYSKLYSQKAQKSQNVMDDKNRIEYAKVLCNLKNWSKAKELVQNVKLPQQLYILGIADFNLQNYAAAKKSFDSFIAASEDGDADKAMAVFYSAYSSYKAGNYEDAYSAFDKYTKKYAHSKKLVCDAYQLSARAGIMLGDYTKAVLSAEKLIAEVPSQAQKYQASLFCSQIYADFEKYDLAAEKLAPFAQGRSEYKLPAMFQTALIYEKASELVKADSIFEKIYTDYPNEDLAEEAMYHSGELYYSVKEYKSAEERFTKYIYKYVKGRFSDAAYYFSGECSLFLTDYNRCIMQNTTLLSQYPDSIYVYNGSKNLIQAYYAQNDYSSALKIARDIYKKFPKQAEADEINLRIKELEQIVSGADRVIVEKQSEYEKNGKLSTIKGRISGSELVQLYAASGYDSDLQKAFTLANDLLNNQSEANEALYMAGNADFIANYYRKSEQNKLSAQMYLKAAEYYRLSEDSDSAKVSKAAAALYSAAEAFMAADLQGDAKATAQLLVKLYPGSKQAERVKAIVK